MSVVMDDRLNGGLDRIDWEIDKRDWLIIWEKER